jgi:hypothetical protein
MASCGYYLLVAVGEGCKRKLAHIEMCAREGTSLQRGMNFGLGGDHSVVPMSVRPNAPYRDRLEDNGTTLIYEGHDEPQSNLRFDIKSRGC